MEKKISMMLYAVVALTLLNVAILAVQFIPPARAAVAGMGHRDLIRDRDFVRAVESVVEDCTVDVDGDTGSISC